MLLKELGSASKLLTDFKDMYEYENRLKTFTNWPFKENCKCTPENVSLKLVVLAMPYFLFTVHECEALISIFVFRKSCELLLSLFPAQKYCSNMTGFRISSYRTEYSYFSCFYWFYVLVA